MHGKRSRGRPARTYIDQLMDDTQHDKEELPVCNVRLRWMEQTSHEWSTAVDPMMMMTLAVRRARWKRYKNSRASQKLFKYIKNSN